MSAFMSVLTDGLVRLGSSANFIGDLRVALNAIAGERPELAVLYNEALAKRDASMIERLLLICQDRLDDAEDLWIGNLRINGLTKRLYVGTGRSTPLFADQASAGLQAT